MIIATVTGRLGKDAETKSVNGKDVINFSIASNDGRGDSKVATWIDCSMWRKSAVVDFLRKGKLVLVSGKLRTREHNGKTYLVVDCDQLELLGDKPAGDRYGEVAPAAEYVEPPLPF